MRGRYVEQLSVMVEAARRAGDAIVAIARRGYDVENKAGIPQAAIDSEEFDPVTTADREADRIIREVLSARFPTHGWLSEESADDGSRFRCTHVWVVDPIDGTREFVRQRPEYTVSIGLLRENEPVAGVIYNPSNDELYAGHIDDCRAGESSGDSSLLGL